MTDRDRAGPRIALVAGEVSGDMLGGGLIRRLREIYPGAVFEGVGGAAMAGAGCESLFPMERLSVMGLFEVLVRLPELLTLRRALLRKLKADPPDIFIGIDAPDFTLPVERKLKAHGVPTVHYVSPTVWAWRQGRVRSISRSVDLMLTLFPFEARFYRECQVPVCTVGHPLADEVGDGIAQEDARAALGLAHQGPVLALLPGSRIAELERMGVDMLAAAAWVAERRPGLGVVVPCATDAIRQRLEALSAENGARHLLTLVNGHSREVIAAADVVLLASGTATLEAALLGRPMVVVYRMHKLTFALAKRLVKVPWVSLPNLLAGRALVPEFLQDEVNAQTLGPVLLRMLEPTADHRDMLQAFDRIRVDLRRDASRSAASAISQLLEQRRQPQASRNTSTMRRT